MNTPTFSLRHCLVPGHPIHAPQQAPRQSPSLDKLQALVPADVRKSCFGGETGTGSADLKVGVFAFLSS